MRLLNFPRKSTVFGGGERIRTADLPRAKLTLYQLSYTPFIICQKTRGHFIDYATWPRTTFGGPKST